MLRPPRPTQARQLNCSIPLSSGNWLAHRTPLRPTIRTAAGRDGQPGVPTVLFRMRPVRINNGCGLGRRSGVTLGDRGQTTKNPFDAATVCGDCSALVVFSRWQAHLKGRAHIMMTGGGDHVTPRCPTDRTPLRASVSQTWLLLSEDPTSINGFFQDIVVNLLCS